MADVNTDKIAQCILELCAERGADKTICPSEVARALSAKEDVWRQMMPDVRAVASKLAKQGKINVTQRGKVVEVNTAKGPIRLSLAQI